MGAARARGGICAARWAELALGLSADLSHSANLIGYGRYLDSRFLADLLRPVRHTAIVAWDPFATPLALVPLGIVGSAYAWRARAHRAWLVPAAAIAISLALYLPKDSPHADPYRFQLPTFTFWAALAGLGIAGLAARDRRLGVTAGAALALTGVVARDPLEGGWAWQHEYRFLVDHRDEMPPDTVVLYRSDQDPNHAFGIWMDGVSAGTWRPVGATPPREGTWLYRGTADRIAAVWPPLPCDLQPIDVVKVPATTDGWVDLGTDPVEIGFYRVGHCQE